METPVDVSLFSALFTVYPNPASEELHIEMIPSEKPEKQGAEVPDNTAYEIKFFDPSGTELHSQVASGTKATLNVRHWTTAFIIFISSIKKASSERRYGFNGDDVGRLFQSSKLWRSFRPKLSIILQR